MLIEEEAARLINDEEVKQMPLKNAARTTGLSFFDQIDKGGSSRRQRQQWRGLTRRRSTRSSTAGRRLHGEHALRTLSTDHILFIASGAFHVAKPSDLVPELQGRLPIRVELQALSSDDFKRILTEPDAALTRQYQALLETEGVHLEFGDDAITRLAEIAFAVNESTENIGARRLHTVMEHLLEEISYSAPDRSGETLHIDAAYVDKYLAELADNEDLSRYIL